MNHHIQVLPRVRALALIATALATTALNAQAGTTKTDPVNGHVWQIFDNVSDGEAQGYRRATVDDFKQLLADLKWLPREGTTSVYDLTNNPSPVWSVNEPNLLLDSYHATSLPNSIIDSGAQAAWLQDGRAGDALGVVETGWTKVESSEFVSVGTHYFYPIVYKHYFSNTAEVVHASELTTKFAAGNTPSTFSGTSYSGIPLAEHPFDPLYGYRQPNGSILAGTYMTTVPEPASAALLSLGLMGVVASACARRSQQAHRQG